MGIDRAGRQYWQGVWENASLPQAMDPNVAGLRNYVARQFHEYFKQAFSSMDTRGKRLIEIGCANSAWLPYLEKQFQFDVSGIDYSSTGCMKAKQVLSRENIDGDIVCADLFSPSREMLGKYDVVISLGLVEHFEDTVVCLKALSRFVKDGGLLVTSIPNMVGLIGSIQKLTNRVVFDVHVPVSREALDAAHRPAGLEVLQCDYFLWSNFGVCNLVGLQSGAPMTYVKEVILGVLSRISMAVWLYEETFGALGANRVMSPYINCVARKT